MIITVTLNPALDKTVRVSRLMINGVNRVIDTRLDAGGKGINVSKMIKVLGGETIAMGVLGGESGMYIQHCLSELNINSRFCFVEAPTRTNLKIVDAAMRTSTDINERGEPIARAVLEQVFQNVLEKAQKGDTVVFAGTNPPDTPVELLGEWIQELKRRGIFVCLDATGDAMGLALKAGPHLIKPNKEELEEICGRRLYFDVDVIAAAKDLIAKGVERVAVSLGAEGALFITEDQVIRAYGLRVPVVSTSGAGDAMMGAMTYYLQKGLPWREVVVYAMAAGSAHVTYPGFAAAEKEKIEELAKQVRIDELM